MALAFCHLMQLPPRMSYDAAEWLASQSLFQLFGPPVGALIEGGAVLSAAILVFLVRARRPAFWWTLSGALCLVVAHLVWWIVVAPVNAEISTWTPTSIPANWMSFRASWEYTHAARAVLQVFGLSALIIAVLVETPRSTAQVRRAPMPLRALVPPGPSKGYTRLPGGRSSHA